MNKLTSTVTLAAFTAVCSFGALAAGSEDTDKGKETMTKPYPPESESKKDKDRSEPSSTSEIMREKMPKDLPEELKHEYRDQEIMNKKPYKQK